MALDHNTEGKSMTSITAPANRAGESAGRLNYLDASIQSSLYRNGKLLMRRNADGSDTGMEGVVFDERQMTIHNARLLDGPERRCLGANGLELLTCPL